MKYGGPVIDVDIHHAYNNLMDCSEFPIGRLGLAATRQLDSHRASS